MPINVRLKVDNSASANVHYVAKKLGISTPQAYELIVYAFFTYHDLFAVADVLKSYLPRLVDRAEPAGSETGPVVD